MPSMRMKLKKSCLSYAEKSKFVEIHEKIIVSAWQKLTTSQHNALAEKKKEEPRKNNAGKR